ncbi:MAG: family 16 glycosylhydrolase [Terrimonas sp.]|nr:family 16 glycosylhydrolase [Terrimonas sp.]
MLLVGYCFAGCDPGNPPKENPEPVKENLIFFEDFNTPHLDSSIWNTEVTGMHVNKELQAYVDSSAVISIVDEGKAEGATGGALLLQPRYTPGLITKDGQAFDFISGRINTRKKLEFTYGTVAARIKLTAGTGVWPAWWLMGTGDWPASGEIDIMEYVGEKDCVSAAVHGPGYSGDAGLVNRYYFSKDADATGWHTYAVDWSKDSLVFRYDGVAMFRVTKPMTTFFGQWVFDTPKFLVLNFAVGGVYPFKTNGISSPYFGLPAATVKRIEEGKDKMWVDWVKVTQQTH